MVSPPMSPPFPSSLVINVSCCLIFPSLNGIWKHCMPWCLWSYPVFQHSPWLHASRKHVASLNSSFHLSLLVTNSSKMFSMMETHGYQCSEVSFPPKAPKPPQSWTIENGLSFPELICTRPLCEHRVETHSDHNKHLLCDFYYHKTYE